MSNISTVEEIIRYENGEMNEDEIITLFQKLIQSGEILHLQGHYGRMAQHLINTGQVIA